MRLSNPLMVCGAPSRIRTCGPQIRSVFVHACFIYYINNIHHYSYHRFHKSLYIVKSMC